MYSVASFDQWLRRDILALSELKKLWLKKTSILKVQLLWRAASCIGRKSAVNGGVSKISL